MLSFYFSSLAATRELSVKLRLLPLSHAIILRLYESSGQLMATIKVSSKVEEKT